MKRVAPLQTTTVVTTPAAGTHKLFKPLDLIWLPAPDDDQTSCFIQTRVKEILPDNLKGLTINDTLFVRCHPKAPAQSSDNYARSKQWNPSQ